MNGIYRTALLCGMALSAAQSVSNSASAKDAEPKSGLPVYVTIFGGMGMTDRVTFDSFDSGAPAKFFLDTKTGYTLGGAVGLNISNAIRAEIEVSHSDVDFNSISSEGISGSFTSVDFEGSVKTTYGLANLWADWRNESPLTPYLGGGLGLGWTDAKLDSTITPAKGLKTDEVGFAFQFGAGVKYDISDHVAVDLGYRFKGVADIDFDVFGSAAEPLTGGDFYTHNVQLGLTYQF